MSPINNNMVGGGNSDQLPIAFTPVNSTPVLEGHTTATNQLSAILNGIDKSGIDVVGMRMDASADGTSLGMSYSTSNQIRLYNQTDLAWEIVKVSSLPTALAASAVDMGNVASI